MISSRCYYALKAVLELAQNEGGGLLTIREIAKNRQIPVRFLEAILLELKQQGIARSVRGKSGGYAIARTARKVTVAEVIRVFDPDVLTLKPAEATRASQQKTPYWDVFDELWKLAEQCIANVLGGCTFYDLVIREQQMQGEAALDFTI